MAADLSLPAIPGGWELEDYVAALAQADGLFVEKQIIDRQQKEILELDIVCSDYVNGRPRRQLLEVKSGKWGFPDLFKLLGWKTYLSHQTGDIARALLIATRLRDQNVVELVDRTLGRFGIELVAVGDHRAVHAAMTEKGLLSKTEDRGARDAWRYSHWVERKYREQLRSWERQHPNHIGVRKVLSYLDLIDNSSFFVKALPERITMLYDAHFEHPKLAMSLSEEMDGKPFNATDPKMGETWRQSLSRGTRPVVDACFYYEHKSRLTILKAAVDYAHLANLGENPESSLEPDGWVKVRAEQPESFYQAVHRIRSMEFADRLPAFWQSFLWKWGGFVLLDESHEEFSLLAGDTGMPLESVEAAIGIYDTLFPIGTNRSWFYKFPEQNPKVMALKMFPTQMKGIGANLRIWRSGSADYEGFKGEAPYRTLINWNNSLCDLLAG